MVFKKTLRKVSIRGKREGRLLQNEGPNNPWQYASGLDWILVSARAHTHTSSYEDIHGTTGETGARPGRCLTLQHHC